jgi:hypothetical protein
MLFANSCELRIKLTGKNIVARTHFILPHAFFLLPNGTCVALTYVYIFIHRPIICTSRIECGIRLALPHQNHGPVYLDPQPDPRETEF